MPLLRTLAVAGVVVAAADAAGITARHFDGSFVRGVETAVPALAQGATAKPLTFLELVDVARRQYSAGEFEYQSINQLYRGDWDGMMEGPTWGAWWTQNSFGPTMAGLPFMDDVTFAAHSHSMRWWFDGIGDGKAQGLTKEGPAPDGCLCDAAMPCAPRTSVSDETCAWYKQGDGLVPLHDWTIEETLSGLCMQAEMLLVARNVTGAKYFMPLFLRTSALLESRRDEATGNTTHLTGPSTNLLAPSFGGGPNGTRAYLAGVSITYVAALDRLIELARLTGDTATETLLQVRRTRTLAGLGLFLEQANPAAVAATAAAGERLHAARARRRRLDGKALGDAAAAAAASTAAPATKAAPTTAAKGAGDGKGVSCTPAGYLCGASAPKADACCGNATCRQDDWCGGAAPPADRPYSCHYLPPPQPAGCHKLGEACGATDDCCLSPHCNRVYCDTQVGQCAESPPPPVAAPAGDDLVVDTRARALLLSSGNSSAGGSSGGGGDDAVGCTPAGALCGASNPEADACCGNATCRQDDWCGGAAPPPDRPYSCHYLPPPQPVGCHKLGEACRTTDDCCLSPHCNRVYCDTQVGQCAESPPPPVAAAMGEQQQQHQHPQQQQQTQKKEEEEEEAAADLQEDSSPTHYFVRSIDPAASGGARHGVLGAAAFGYFEASPNHDAVAWRVVNDSLAEEIMATIDGLGSAIRPNAFILPNTDAGGGGGYDDMLCPDGSTWCNGVTRGGIFAYGTWVNGGVWTTQEARAILAYFRTGRPEAAAASYNAMLHRFSRSWTMDAPLPDFGLTTWAHLPVMLTIDAFGCAAGMMRGMFEYLYTASSLTLLPHLPDSVTALQQDFPVRWGPYRLYIATHGVPSSGISAVAVNGEPLESSPGRRDGGGKGSHAFNATAVVLNFASMPAASAAAAAATGSDVSTAADAVNITIMFKTAGNFVAAGGAVGTAAPPTGVVGGVPAGYTLRLRASDLAATLKPGDSVTSWTSTAPAATAFAVPAGGAYLPPVFALDAAGRPSVVFHEDATRSGAADKSALTGALPLPPDSTLFAVLRDDGTVNMYSSVVHVDTDRGLAIDPLHCSTGNPTGPRPCGPHAARTVAVDYAGSGDHGKRNISGQTIVAGVAYGMANASSSVDGCSEQAGAGAVVAVVPTGASATVGLGLRLDGYDRQFNGAVLEVLAYPRTLDAQEVAAVVAALQATYKLPKRDCGTVAPPTPAPAPAPAPRPVLDCAALRTSLNCNQGNWPRKCGLSDDEIKRLTTFISKLEGSGAAYVANLPYAMATEALSYTRGFDARCAGLNNGSVPALPSEAANAASLTLMLTAGGNLYAGLDNALSTRYSAPSATAFAQGIAQMWADTRHMA